jgi:mercuric ion transport protein
LIVLAAAALMVLCCAGPVLIASGAVAGIGTALRNPWLIGISTPVVLAAMVYTVAKVARRHRPDQNDTCCPPRPTEQPPRQG